MTRSIFLICVLSYAVPAQPGALTLDLVHHLKGETVATSTLRLEGGRLFGTVAAGDVEIVARLSHAPGGHVLSYERVTRKTGRLVSRLSLTLRADGAGYRLREERPLGTRRETIRTGKARAVLDPDWPEAVIPALLDLDAGDLPIVHLPRGEVVLGKVLPRDGGSRFLDVPGGGPTLEVAGDRSFRRLRLPGEGATSIVRAGEESAAAGPTAPPSVVESPLDLPTGLSGTLTLPREFEGSLPGVVLVADAGARDRDGNGVEQGSSLLRDLAWELADRGFGVLRFDPRDPAGAGVRLATLQEDVRAAGMVLRSRVEVDGDRIGVIGHGQGGLIAVGAAVDRKDLFRAVICLAPPARPLRQAVTARLRARLLARGSSEAAVRSADRALQADLDRIRGLSSEGDFGPGERVLKDLMGVVPVDLYLEVGAPLLLLFGAQDREVPVGHRALVQTAVALHGGGGADLQVLPSADHEFRETRAGAPASGDADVARRRHPSLAPVVTSFLEARLSKK